MTESPDPRPAEEREQGEQEQAEGGVEKVGGDQDAGPTQAGDGTDEQRDQAEE